MTPLPKTKKVKQEKWLKAIPKSTGHGSNDYEKRLWRTTSDLVRIRDFYRWGRVTVTGEIVNHWSEGDAGHYKSYSCCTGLFKFSPMNIHLQGKASNGWGGQDVGYRFGETLKKRYGSDYLDLIEQENRNTPIKYTIEEVREEIKENLRLMGKLPEQPPYYQRAIKLLEESNA